MTKKRDTEKKGTVPMTQDTAVDIAATPVPVQDEAPKTEQLALDDLRVLQLSFKELENLALKHRLAQMELENLAKAVEAGRANLTKLNEAVNVKYGLDPAKDRINIQDGVITRG